MANQPTTHRSPIGLYLRSPLGVRSGATPPVLASIDGSGNGMYSSNASAWSASVTLSIPTGAIAWSPTKKIYVAVGNNVIKTSPDGKTWTTATVPSGGQNWTGVCWSPTLGIFCAVANSGGGGVSGTNRIMTWDGTASPWVAGADLASGARAWIAIAWSESIGKFVATQFGHSIIGSSLMYSSTGLTGSWTGANRAIDPVSGSQCDSGRVAAGNGRFVIIASDARGVPQVSTDGITWTAGTAPEARAWSSIAYSPTLDIFVMVTNSGSNRIATSAGTDGLTWALQTAPELNFWTDVCWSPILNLFVAVSTNGTHRVMTWDGSASPWVVQSASSALSWGLVAAQS